MAWLLSLSGGFIWLNLAFPPIIAGMLYLLQSYCTSPEVEAMREKRPSLLMSPMSPTE